MTLIIKICAAIGTLLQILQLYKNLYYLGVIKNKTYNTTSVQHKYAICIAARNEQKVIKNLLESIDNQDYHCNSSIQGTWSYWWNMCFTFNWACTILANKHTFNHICLCVLQKTAPKNQILEVCLVNIYGTMFYKIGQYCTYVALFKKVEWKPIPHDYTVDVKKL